MRYQHCLTRAMTLIKMHFINTLRALTTEIQRRLSDKVWSFRLTQPTQY